MTPKELQKRLGHRDFNTTMNVYGHVLRKEKDTATTAFENLLKRYKITLKIIFSGINSGRIYKNLV